MRIAEVIDIKDAALRAALEELEAWEQLEAECNLRPGERDPGNYSTPAIEKIRRALALTSSLPAVFCPKPNA